MRYIQHIRFDFILFGKKGDVLIERKNCSRSVSSWPWTIPNPEWIVNGSRDNSKGGWRGAGQLGWKEAAVVGGGCRQRGKAESGVREPVEWPELDSTWTTYFYIAREIMGFPSWSGFPSGASGHRCTRQEILHRHPRHILSVSCSRPTFIVLVHPRSFTCLIQPHPTHCATTWRVHLIFEKSEIPFVSTICY